MAERRAGIDPATGDTWYILGAGAIGTLFAHRLAGSGCPVSLLTRAQAAGAVELQLESFSGAVKVSQFTCSPCAADGRIDNLLVTTKAFAVAPALTSVAHRLHGGTRAVVLANGMGFEHELPPRLSSLNLLRGTTTDGAFRRDNRTTVHAGRGETRIGEPGADSAAPNWFAHSLGRLARCEWSRAIDALLWRKLAINCVINPLTAVADCPNGDLLRGEALRPEVGALCDEVAAACTALGQPEAARDLQQAVRAVLRATRRNRSSMLQDRQLNRRTEIDYLNGFLLSRVAGGAAAMPLSAGLIRQLAEPAAENR